MAVRTSFTAGEVLAAADLTDTFGSKVDYALTPNAQSGTGASAYTFVLADASRLTTATGATAKTFTIPPQASVAWAANSIIRVVNYGAGALTVNGGSGVTVTNTATTLAQYQSASAIRTGSNAWTLVPFGGGGLSWAKITGTTGSPTTGTYTANSVLWRWYQWTGNGSVTTTDGVVETLVVGGGAFNGDQMGARVCEGILRAPSGTHNITIGAAGPVNGQGGSSQIGTFGWAGNIGSSPNGSPQYYTGAGRPGAGGTNPWISSLTGTAQNVGGSAPNTGRGSTSVAGVVVIRVPE